MSAHAQYRRRADILDNTHNKERVRIQQQQQ